MIIAIAGPTCSGKTTLAKKFEERGFERVVTYTTRPRREGEVDGVDYHFVLDEDFSAMEKGGEFFETTKYHAYFGECKYGTRRDDILGTKTNKVIVLDVKGAIKLKEFTSQVNLIYLFASLGEARLRALHRGDDLSEVDRRYESDINHFFWNKLYRYVDGCYSTLAISSYDDIVEKWGNC